ncbi:MAG: PEGA domain-containing protein [Myxococcota bacterium]
MFEFTRVRACSALVALVAVALAPSAWADVLLPDLPETGRATDSDRADARAAYEDATEAYGAGKLDDALEAAERAWTALPNASTALIRATILGDLKRDRDAFEAYLQAADLSPAPEETALIDSGLAKHGPRVSPAMGWATVRSTPSGADAILDGYEFRTPRTVGVSAGKHELELVADGFSPIKVTITARSGRATASTTRLVPSARPVEAPSDPPDRGEEAFEGEDPPPPPKLRHQRTQIRPYLNLGFPGKAKITLTDSFLETASGDSDLNLSYGFGLYLDIPMRSVFALGVELGFGTWTTKFHSDSDLGPNFNVDIGFVPRFRVPIKDVAEIYLSIPVGLTIGVDKTVGLDDNEKTTNVGPGVYLGLYLGGKVYVTQSLGIFLEGGWTAHFWIFATDPTTQWTTRHGAIRTGVAILF